MKRWITAVAVSLAALLALTACGGPVAPAPELSNPLSRRHGPSFH